MSRSHKNAHASNIAHERAQAGRRAAIRRLNDLLRQRLVGGIAMMTPGVRDLAPHHLAIALRRIASFDAFNPDNDPYDEHDFGTVEVAGIQIFWKIEAYDKSLEYGSPDPSDPAVTTRVLTIMLPEEY